MNKFKYNPLTGKLDLVESNVPTFQQVLNAGNIVEDQYFELRDTGSNTTGYYNPSEVTFYNATTNQASGYSLTAWVIDDGAGTGTAAEANHVRWTNSGYNNIVGCEPLTNTRALFIPNEDGVLSVKPDNVIQVNNVEQLGTPVSGYYQLLDNYAYRFSKSMDLSPYGLEYNGTVLLEGTNSELAFLTSDCSATPLSAGAFIKGTGTLNIEKLTIQNIPTAVFDIDNTTAPNSVADWKGVNFSNCEMGIINTFSNFIYEVGTFINCKGLVFTGTFNTIAFTRTPYVVQTSGTGIILDAGCVINRRFRMFQCPFTLPDGTIPNPTVGIEVEVGAVIPNSQFSLLNVAFSQPASSLVTPVLGITNTDNRSNWVDCTNIANSATTFLYYWVGNTTPTVVTPDVFAKAEDGSLTSPGTYVQRFTITGNRATCDSILINVYELKCTATISTGTTSAVVKAQLYKNGSPLPASYAEETTTATGGTERVTNIAMFDNVPLTIGDYIELWVTTLSGVDPVVERAAISGVKINN